LLESQVGTAFSRVGQSSGVQQALLAMQLSPQRLNPVSQVKPQPWPPQLAMALGGDEHGVHERPQLLVLVSLAQVPLQSCVPAGHWPVHARSAAMQLPAHSFMASGHLPPHETPSQVALPPWGSLQGLHEVPQVAMSELLTHLRAQTWLPTGHE
jgi:hypothetical protein